jgi:hypothetical protein
LFLKLATPSPDAATVSRKRRLDEAIIKKLLTANLGDQVENDEKNEPDLHFIVPKDYRDASQVISATVKEFGFQDEVILFQREYGRDGKWIDHEFLQN